MPLGDGNDYYGDQCSLAAQSIAITVLLWKVIEVREKKSENTTAAPMIGIVTSRADDYLCFFYVNVFTGIFTLVFCGTIEITH